MMSTARSANQPDLLRANSIAFAAPGNNPRSQPAGQQLLEGDVLPNRGSSWTAGDPSSLATDIEREDLLLGVATTRGGVAVGEGGSARPWTAAAAVGGAHGPIQPPPDTLVSPPPAGMMTVRVRIGSEETSLVTPIVVAENSSNTAAPEVATAGPEETTTSATADDEIGTHQPPGAAQRGSVEAGARDSSAQRPAVVLGARTAQPIMFRAEEPIVRRAVEVQGTDATQGVDGASIPEGSSSGKGKNRADHGSKAEASPPSAIAVVRIGPLLPSRISTVFSTAKLDEERPKGDVEKKVARETEQFMEDSQVYLGCAICGVKYLVEAVDPRLPKSTKGGFPSCDDSAVVILLLW